MTRNQPSAQARHLRQLRTIAGFTMREVAADAGITEKVLQHYESGGQDLPGNTYLTLAGIMARMEARRHDQFLRATEGGDDDQ